MPPDVVLSGIPFHVQDARDFCGAATAQIVIAAAKLGLEKQSVLHASILAAGVAHPDPLWVAHPEALADVIARQLATVTRPAGQTVGLASTSKADAALEGLIDALDTSGRPQVIPSGRFSHWIVFIGHQVFNGDLALWFRDPAGRRKGKKHADDSLCCDPDGVPHPAEFAVGNYISNYVTPVSAGVFKDQYLRVETVGRAPPPRPAVPRASLSSPDEAPVTAVEARSRVSHYLGLEGGALPPSHPWSKLTRELRVLDPVRLEDGTHATWWVPVAAESPRGVHAPKSEAPSIRFVSSIPLTGGGGAVRLLADDTVLPMNVAFGTSVRSYDGDAPWSTEPDEVALHGPPFWRAGPNARTPLLPLREGTLRGDRVVVRADGLYFRSRRTDVPFGR